MALFYTPVTLGESRQHEFESQEGSNFLSDGSLKASWLLFFAYDFPYSLFPGGGGGTTTLDYSLVHSKPAGMSS